MPPPHPRPGKPPAPAPYPTPLLRLKVQDLSSPAARRFLSSTDTAEVLEDAVHTVLDLLYPGQYQASWPGTRSVTLVLESFGGVAYTRGRALDDDHKEIHLSTDYIVSIKPELLGREIKGVVVHEMVHCWQRNGCGKAPGGLVEGIADWVRLRANLSPPHWKRTTGDRWDAGYQITAWFLDWLEDEYGEGTVPKLNCMLKDVEYDEKKYWSDRCGLHKSVQQLWKEYKRWLAEKDDFEKVKDEEVEHKDGCERSESTDMLVVNSRTKKEGEEEEKEQEKEEQQEEEENGGRRGEASNNNKAECPEDYSELRESEKAESELENGWTELSSGGHELKRRESKLDR